jgi:hypothetical protein
MTKSAAARQSTLIEQTRRAAHERNLARLADLTAEIRRRMTAVVESFYDIGEALREVVDRKLYGVAGHASLAAWLAAEGILSERQAAKLIAVARKVPRAHALALGPERSYALLSYAEAAENDTVAALLAPGATVAGKPVAEASVREIEAAAREARASRREGRPRTEAERARAAEDAAITRALRAALRELGVGGAAVRVTRAQVRVVLTRAQAAKLAAT